MIELTAFLGNPGEEYSRNRHNAGFLLAEKAPFTELLSWQKKFSGLYAAIDRERLSGVHSQEDKRLHFIKPLTYMNLSGKSVAKAASFFKIKSEAVLVIHDELELPLGTISLKMGGGLGGHNGLRSMREYLGNADFWRIRIGIGRPDKRFPGEGGPPGSGEGIVDWVLTDFEAAEEDKLGKALEAGSELLRRALTENPEDLLPEWRKRKIDVSLPA
jgi:PTH1 family peptidyl-tRNA hydrolase